MIVSHCFQIISDQLFGKTVGLVREFLCCHQCLHFGPHNSLTFHPVQASPKTEETCSWSDRLEQVDYDDAREYTVDGYDYVPKQLPLRKRQTHLVHNERDSSHECSFDGNKDAAFGIKKTEPALAIADIGFEMIQLLIHQLYLTF